MKYFFRFPIINILVILVLTAFLGFQLRNAEIDNDVSTMIPKDHPSNVANRILEDEFGGSDMILVGLEAKSGSILTLDNLRVISEMSERFEEIEHVDNVVSITNADFIDGTYGGLEVYSLSDELPEDEDELEEFQEKLTSWDLYRKNLFSDDFKATSIVLTMGSEAKTPQHKIAYDQLRKILTDYNDSNFNIYTSGYPAITVLVGEYMVKDLIFLIPVVIIMVLLILILSFKRLGGVLLPILTVLISTVWAMGIMTMVGKKITLISTCIPIVLVAVGSAYGIHIITHYYEEIMIRHGKIITGKRHDTIVFHVLKTVGKPVLLAALTTCAGFSSLITSSIIPLKDFGMFCSVGVAAAVIVSLVFIPSILLKRHKSMKQTKSVLPAKKSILSDFLIGSYHFLIKHRIIFILFTIALIVFSIYGVIHVNIDTQMVKNFKKNSTIYQADEYLNGYFAGTNILNIKIGGENDGDLIDPEVLYQMEQLGNYLENRYTDVGKVIGFNDFVKRMNQVMHYPDEEGVYYEIPYDPAKYGFESKDKLKRLIAQYLLLYTGELDAYVADDVLAPNKARMNILLHSSRSDLTTRLIEDVRDFSEKHFPEHITVSVAGGADLNKAVNDLVISGQILSLLISLIVVFFIVAISFKSIMAGIIGVIPLSFSLLINFGIMGFFNIDLNIGTAMIASLAVGIGVDYTIHFMASYHHNRLKSDDLEVVTKNTLKTSGKAIIFNAASVGLGFAVLGFSNFVPLMYVGLLVAIVMLTSSLGAMTFLPALLNIFKPKFVRK